MDETRDGREKEGGQGFLSGKDQPHIPNRNIASPRDVLFLAKGWAFLFFGSHSRVDWEWLEEVHIRVGIDCIHSTLGPPHSLPVF